MCTKESRGNKGHRFSRMALCLSYLSSVFFRTWLFKYLSSVFPNGICFVPHVLLPKSWETRRERPGALFYKAGDMSSYDSFSINSIFLLITTVMAVIALSQKKCLFGGLGI